VATAGPIAAQNSVEMTDAGKATSPEHLGLFSEQRILDAVIKRVPRPEAGTKHVINVVEIHKDAWISHLTAPADRECRKVRPFFPKSRPVQQTDYNVLDTLARTVTLMPISA